MLDAGLFVAADADPSASLGRRPATGFAGLPWFTQSVSSSHQRLSRPLGICRWGAAGAAIGRPWAGSGAGRIRAKSRVRRRIRSAW